MLGLAAAAFGYVAVAGSAAPKTAPLCQVDRITDGDTIDVRCGGGAEHTLRLKCIDAPEHDQAPWGERATRALRQGLGDQVRVVAHEQDPYGRTVATIYSPDGRDNYNLAMVRAGHAAVYDRYCENPRYPRAAEEARTQDRGIWARPGLHQRPWRYRAQQ